VKTALLAAAVAMAAVAVAAALLWSSGPITESAGDLGAAAGIIDRSPFVIRLDGPLWRDRTTVDAQGARDVALISRDEALGATIRGSRIAAVEVRVDGRVQQRIRPPCPLGRCPRTLRVRLAPRLNPRSGGVRRIDVVVRGAADSQTGVGSFRVSVVARMPGVREAEPAPRAAARSPQTALPAPRRRAALRLLGEARRGGGLRALLGDARLRLRAAGALRDGRRTIGATLLFALATPRHDVAGTVPGYLPSASPSPAYVPRLVSLRAAVLADLLVDVDLQQQRVISVEPGPASVTTAWSPGDPPVRAGVAADPGAVTDTAARAPRLVAACRTTWAIARVVAVCGSTATAA
jgi:hypothetical protein